MIKVSVLLLLGLAADAACRKQSAALRHWVLTAAVLCGTAAPMLEVVVPSWRLPAPPMWFTGTVEPVRLLVTIGASSSVQDPARLDVASAVQSPPVRRLMNTIWLSGAAVSLAVLLMGLARLAWLASKARIVSEAQWKDVASELSLRYRLSKPVRLLESAHPSLLAACGVWKPKVILPPAARSWSRDRARIVLGHEFAHVRRNDWLIQILAACLRSVYWFNPLAWIMCRRLRDASEQACDDFVLAMGIEGHDYATHLLELARTFGHRATVIPAPAMARPSSLERRVTAMLNVGVNRSPLSRTATVAVLLLLAGVTVPVASVVVAAQTGVATFSGSLMDAVGRPLPDTTLTVSNISTEQRIDAQSDQTGHFTFSRIPAGEYLLQVRKPGFATSQGRITLAAGQNLNRDVALQVGGIEETFTVHGGDDRAVSSQSPMPRTAPPTGQDDSDRCAQASIGGCITPPAKIAHYRPAYPAKQRESGVGGKVVIEGRIGTDGLTKDLRAVAPADPDLASAAFDAVSRWRFTTTRLDGVPIEVNIRVTALFVPQ